MGGGKKQTQRTKGNLKPSSSSRAAETLLQEGKTGFVGFGGLSEATGNSFGYVPKPIGTENESEHEIDSELRMLMRKMTKKDTTTRLKAVQEFSKLCADKKDDCVSRILAFWPKIYNKLTEDFDHRVREAIQQAHLEIVRKVGRKLAPQLKLIIGNWLKSHFDQYLPAAVIAKRSFDLTFNGDKKKETFSFCKKELIMNIQDVLIHQTQDTLSDPKVVPVEEREAKYNRLVSATLLSLGFLLDNLSDVDIDSISGEIHNILKEKKFWKFSKHNFPMIRNAFFTAVSSTCQNCKNLLKDFSSVACPTVLLCLDESDPTVVRSLWECCLHIVNDIEDCWDRVNARKAILPKLWSIFRGGGYGNATVIYPNVLPFLSKIPSKIIGDDDGFFREFFRNFRDGLSSEKPSASSSESVAIMSAFMECLRYVLLNKMKEENQDIDNGAVFEYLINEEISYFVDCCLQEQKIFWKKVFSKKLSELFSYLEKQTLNDSERLSEKLILEKLFHLLENSCLKSINLEKIVDQNAEKNILKNIEELIRIVVFKSNDILGEQKKSIKFVTTDGDDESYTTANSSLSCSNNSNRGQNMEEAQDLSKCSSLLLSKLCRSSVELLFAKKKLLNLSFTCNILSNIKEKTIFIELVTLVLKTTEDVTNKPEKEADPGKDLLSLGNELIKNFITPAMQKDFSLEASFRESVDCQEAVVNLLCSMLLLTEKERKISFLALLDEFCSRPLLHCLLVEKVLASLEVDAVMVWFSNGVCVSRLVNYVSQCLFSAGENAVADDDNHVWKCIQQCLFYKAGKVPLLDSKQTEQLFIIFKNYLTLFEPHNDTKNCLRILLIMTEFYKEEIQNENTPVLLADLLVATFQVTFRIDNDDVVAQGNKMLRYGLDLLRASSSQKMMEFMQRIAYWLKKSSSEFRDFERLAKLADCTVNMISYLMINEDDVNEANIVNGFVNQLLKGNETKEMCQQGVHLLPSVLSGFLNVSNLHGKQHAFNTDFQKVLNASIFETLLMSRLDIDLKDSNQIHTTILDSICLIAYGDETMTKKCICSQENKDVSSMLELDKSIKSLLQTDKIDKESLLRTSLDRALENGGVHVLTFDRLCKMISDFNQSDSPYSELLACAISRGYNDLDSIDVLKVILTHLGDVSMIRAMVEQFADQLDDVLSEDIQGFSRGLDLCLTSLIRWHRVLQSTKEQSHDFSDVVRTILTQLIGWKDNAQEALLFATDLSEVEITLLDINIKIMRLLCFVLSVVPECLEPTHWDFLLCSLASWIQTCEDNLAILTQDPCAMIFGFEAFNLCACTGLAFERLIGTNVTTSNVIKPALGIKCISNMNSKSTEGSPSTISDNLLSEWQEFFAPAIYKGVYMLYKETVCIVSQSTHPIEANINTIALHLLQSLSCALDSIPALVFIDIVVCKQSFEEQLASGATPQSQAMQEYSFNKEQLSLIKETVNLLSMQLISEFHCVQTVALSLLCKMIDHVHAAITTMTDESTEGDECELVRSFPDKMHSILEKCQDILIQHLEDQAIKIDVYLHEIPADQLTVHFLGYMFSWQCILRMFRGAEADQRAAYANFFRKRGLIGPLLKILFSLLPYETGNQLLGEKVAIKGDKISLQTLRQCAFHVYLSALECIPAVIRSWCNNNIDRKSSSIIERFTCSYMSPILCTRELDQVSNSSKTFTNMSIKTRPVAREVVALYTVEEISMELVVKMSQSHPLGHVVVECGKRVGVTNAQWRQWMLQLTTYLTQQNGTIVDGLSLWKKNVDKKFEGVEECLICFSVVHGTNYQLPTITCRVCKKKFHSACLYKWFSTSNKSTCPLCRNSF